MAALTVRGTTIDYGSAWLDFRPWIDGTRARLRFAWADNGSAYEIVALDGGVFRVVGINKSDPASAEQADFETAFAALGNAPFEARAGSGAPLVATSPFAYTEADARFVGHYYATAQQGVSVFEERLDRNVRLQGGTYWARGAVAGDRVSLSVVDVDNVLGAGAGTVLATYVSRAPLAPWDHVVEFTAPTAGLIPAGVYLRVEVEHASADALSLGVTYRWFENV